MKQMLHFFSTRHLFANISVVVVLAGGVLFWQKTSKEELPEMTLDFVTVTVSYPGASPAEVENGVTWPIEDELRSIDGIEKIESTSSEGSSVISIELEQDDSDRDQVISDIRSTVMGVSLPSEVIDMPVIREFKTSRKAIIDISMYMEGSEFLNDQDRRELQTWFHSLEKSLLALQSVSSTSTTGYLDQEFRIELDTGKMKATRTSIGSVITALEAAAVRQPAGSLESLEESLVTLDGEMEEVPEFLDVPVQGSFLGNLVLLKDIAGVRDTFEEKTGITKINGFEGMRMSVSKSSSADILSAVDDVRREVDLFRKRLGPDSKIKVLLSDDESIDVRNRIELIASNGAVGFILILILLFIFLNFQSGLWVAMGIPFSLSVTMMVTGFLGFTINNITLSAVIIVLGMVVDDAIVVSENVMRLRSRGASALEAAVEGTSAVLLPITASILTTIAAFFPLSLFDGRLSMLTASIPPIVSIMLLASLIESIFILPAHLHWEAPRSIKIIFSLGLYLLVEKYFPKKDAPTAGYNENGDDAGHWFFAIEKRFEEVLEKILPYRMLVIGFFTLAIIGSFYLLTNHMRFTLFPREESTEVRIDAETPDGTTMEVTAVKAGDIEGILNEYLGHEVVGFQTRIKQARFRSVAAENTMIIDVEILPAEERDRSLNDLIDEWQKRLDELKGFKKIQISKERFGPSSGMPIEIVVQQNDQKVQDQVVNDLTEALKKLEGVTSVDTGKSRIKPEYMLRPKRELMERLGVTVSSLGQALRTGLEGVVLYRLIVDDEQKSVRLTVPEKHKERIQQVLDIPVGNSSDYMVPVSQLVTMEKENNPLEIKRLDLQRMVMVYADLDRNLGITPLEIAGQLEDTVFPEIASKYPGTIFTFEGEIKMSREGSSFLPLSVGLIFFLIYTILALQFDSLHRPFTVLLSIPPAVASVVLIFAAHGNWTFGFFGVIGIMGLAGVVVNDAIVLLNSLDISVGEFTERRETNQKIARITSSRLRAVMLTTLTTVAGLFPTAYGVLGYDSMLSEMMLALAWGILFGTIVILFFIPSIYSLEKEMIFRVKRLLGGLFQ